MTAGEARARSELAGRLGSQTMVMFAGYAFTLLCGLPFQIYLARKLGAHDLGMYSLAEGGVVIIAGLCAIGLSPTVMRFVPEHLAAGEGQHVKTLVVGSGLLLLAIGAAAMLLVLAFVRPLLSLFRIDPAYGDLMKLMAALMPLTLLVFFFQQILRGFQEIMYMVAATSFVALTTKIAATVFFFHRGLLLPGYAWANILSVIAALSMMAGKAAWLVRGVGAGRPCGPPPVRRWFRFAATSYTADLLSTLVGQSDRFILGAAVGPAAVGVLAVVRQLQQFPNIFNQMFLTVVSPMFAASNDPSRHADRQTLYSLTMDWVLRLALPMILFLMLFGGELLDIYGPQYREQGALALQLLVLAVGLNFLFGPTGALLNMTGLEAPLLRLSMISLAILIGCYLLLGPVLGLPGLGLGAIASTLFLNATCMVLARRRLQLRWWTSRNVGWMISGAVALLIGIVMKRVTGLPGGLPVFLVTVLVAMYAGSLGVNIVRGFHEDDKAVLSHLASKVRRTRRS